MEELFREFLGEITGNPPRYLAELVQSLLLLFLIWRLGRKTVRQRLDTRRARIVAELAEVAQAERDVPRLEEEIRARTARATQEGPALLQAAAEKARQEREAALAAIEAEAREVLRQAAQAVERDRERLTSESARRLVQLTATAAGRYLDEMLTESDRRSLTQKAIRASLAQLQGPAPADKGAA
jgi:F0F1-type ATP synthase membrane subunit b/b'